MLQSFVHAENLYDDVDPVQLLEVRTSEDDAREYLVRFEDGEEWVSGSP